MSIAYGSLLRKSLVNLVLGRILTRLRTGVEVEISCKNPSFY